MPERDEAGIADQHVEPERENRVEQDLRGDVGVVAVANPERHRRQDDQPQRERQPLHGAALPNSPSGRTTSTTSIGRKSTTGASAGTTPWQKLNRTQTTRLPTTEPIRLPEPPRITTTSASGS